MPWPTEKERDFSRVRPTRKTILREFFRSNKANLWQFNCFGVFVERLKRRSSRREPIRWAKTYGWSSIEDRFDFWSHNCWRKSSTAEDLCTSNRTRTWFRVDGLWTRQLVERWPSRSWHRIEGLPSLLDEDSTSDGALSAMEVAESPFRCVPTTVRDDSSSKRKKKTTTSRAGLSSIGLWLVRSPPWSQMAFSLFDRRCSSTERELVGWWSRLLSSVAAWKSTVDSAGRWDSHLSSTFDYCSTKMRTTLPRRLRSTTNSSFFADSIRYRRSTLNSSKQVRLVRGLGYHSVLQPNPTESFHVREQLVSTCEEWDDQPFQTNMLTTNLDPALIVGKQCGSNVDSTGLAFGRIIERPRSSKRKTIRHRLIQCSSLDEINENN